MSHDNNNLSKLLVNFAYIKALCSVLVAYFYLKMKTIYIHNVIINNINVDWHLQQSLYTFFFFYTYQWLHVVTSHKLNSFNYTRLVDGCCYHACSKKRQLFYWLHLLLYFLFHIHSPILFFFFFLQLSVLCEIVKYSWFNSEFKVQMV